MRFPLEKFSLLLRSIEIERINQDERVPHLYSGFTTQSLLRIHILPYFFPFKSYRHLAFLVAERPELQEMVGLKGPETPSRATLWHFRKRNPVLFSRLLSRALALVSFEAYQKRIQVHFSRPCEEPEAQTDSLDTFTDPKSKVRISTSMRKNVRREQLNLTFFPSNEVPKQLQQKKAKLYDEIQFPMYVRWSKGNECLTLCVEQPSWSEFPEILQDLGKLFGKAGKKPYVACNVIVLDKKKEHILLSLRRTGAGKGTYALPGGKKHDSESIRRCVARELREEVGLEFRNGYIVSDRKTNYPGYPPVRSIGVVATDWAGELKKQNPEPHAHGKWSWYTITDLPAQLFFPTKNVLDDYLGGKFTWVPLEEDLPLSAYWSNQNEH